MITKFTIFLLINNFNPIGYALGVSAISGYDIRRVHATQTACTCYAIGVHHDTLSCLLSSCPTVLLLLRVSCSNQLPRSPGVHAKGGRKRDWVSTGQRRAEHLIGKTVTALPLSVDISTILHDFQSICTGEYILKKSLILMMIYDKQICKCILFFINPASSVNTLGHTNIFAYM